MLYYQNKAFAWHNKEDTNFDLNVHLKSNELGIDTDSKDFDFYTVDSQYTLYWGSKYTTNIKNLKSPGEKNSNSFDQNEKLVLKHAIQLPWFNRYLFSLSPNSAKYELLGDLIVHVDDQLACHICEENGYIKLTFYKENEMVFQKIKLETNMITMEDKRSSNTFNVKKTLIPIVSPSGRYIWTFHMILQDDGNDTIHMKVIHLLSLLYL